MMLLQVCILVILGYISTKLNYIKRKVHNMSVEMDRLTASVAAQKTVDDSVVALLNGVGKQLRDLIAAGSNPAALTALADSIDKNNQTVVDAVTLNTPPVPPVPVV